MRAAALLTVLLCSAPAVADEYPTALIDRPLALPRGLVQIDAALGHETRRTLGIEVLSAEETTLAVRAGFSTRWELGAATSLRLHPDAAWSRETALSGAFRALDGDRLDLAPSLVLPLSFHRGYDLVGTAWLGLGLRARLTDRLFVVAGRRLLPIDVRPAFAVHLGLDGGLGFQATPTIALLAETQAAVVTALGPIDRTTTPLDDWPLALTALWATPSIDTALEVRSRSALAPGNDFSITLRIGLRP